MAQEMTRLAVEGREIVLLGTAHVSRESVEEVRRVISEEKPDRVCVELDEGRHASMSQGNSWQNLNVGKVIREGKGFLLMANLVLASFQRRLGKDLGVKPGEEMLAAIQVSQELGIPYSLCDRNIQVTLRRAWGRTRLWGKMKMLSAMLASVFTNEKLSAGRHRKTETEGRSAEHDGGAGRLPAGRQGRAHRRTGYLSRGEDLPGGREQGGRRGRRRAHQRHCGAHHGAGRKEGNRRPRRLSTSCPQRDGRAAFFPG